jgi:predicted transcriptional regulator
MEFLERTERLTETKSDFLTIRLPPDLSNRLKVLAERNERSVSGEVRLAIREYLEYEGEHDERGVNGS